MDRDAGSEPRYQGVNHLQTNGVEVDFFDMNLMQKIRDENKDFAEQYEKARDVLDYHDHEFEGPSETEKEAVTSASLRDISLNVIKGYLKARNKRFSKHQR